MDRRLLFAGALCMALVSTGAHASICVKPSAPGVPDPGTVDAATRNAVTAQIENYIVATNAYLACLEQADAAARAEAEGIIGTWTSPVTDIEVVTD